MNRIIVAVALAVLCFARPALADLPQTAEEHLAAAAEYREKAAAYRKEQALHKEMADDYKKKMPGPAKSGAANPWVVKMEKHCQAISQDAGKLADDAEKAAEFHEMLAKELSAAKK